LKSKKCIVQYWEVSNNNLQLFKILGWARIIGNIGGGHGLALYLYIL